MENDQEKQMKEAEEKKKQRMSRIARMKCTLLYLIKIWRKKKHFKKNQILLSVN
jgi:hypothetical protein